MTTPKTKSTAFQPVWTKSPLTSPRHRQPPTTPAYTPAVVQQVVVPVAHQDPPLPQTKQDTSSMVDDLDFDGLAQRVSTSTPEADALKPGHDEPVIRGFGLQPDEER